MADVQALRALHYDVRVAGPLADLIAPPYDVIDADLRRRLAARSPYNIVHVDLPEGEDRYVDAARRLDRWRDEGAVTHDPEPAMWALRQEFRGPDGSERTRSGFLCRLKVEPYGEGRIRPHERTHPGPREDRLRLTRATRTNLSPILALHSDRERRAWSVLEPHLTGAPWGEAADDEGTLHRVWRVSDGGALAEVQAALRDSELLIADGHHRYETARAYADEVGGDGPHRYVLTCLVALEDPGLAVFPTHRLVSGLRSDQHEALADAIRRDFEIHEVSREELAPDGDGASPLQLGYMDSHFRRPFRLTLRDQAIADAALPGKPDAYRRLDTAVLEALLLKGALGMTDHDIAELEGLAYARHPSDALALLDERAYDAAFFLRPTPIEQVREVAAAGESMPPKTTFFYPKLATGVVFSPLYRLTAGRGGRWE